MKKIHQGNLEFLRDYYANKDDQDWSLNDTIINQIINDLPSEIVDAEEIRDLIYNFKDTWDRDELSTIEARIFDYIVSSLEDLVEHPDVELNFKFGQKMNHPEHGEVVVLDTKVNSFGDIRVAVEDKDGGGGYGLYWADPADLSDNHVHWGGKLNTEPTTDTFTFTSTEASSDLWDRFFSPNKDTKLPVPKGQSAQVYFSADGFRIYAPGGVIGPPANNQHHVSVEAEEPKRERIYRLDPDRTYEDEDGDRWIYSREDGGWHGHGSGAKLFSSYPVEEYDETEFWAIDDPLWLARPEHGSSLPDPEDVPDDEAWAVLVDGYPAIGFRDSNTDTWTVTTPGELPSWIGTPASDAVITLLHRLVAEEARPNQKKTLTTFEDYEKARIDTVVRSPFGNPIRKNAFGSWFIAGSSKEWTSETMGGTAREVIYEP